MTFQRNMNMRYPTRLEGDIANENPTAAVDGKPVVWIGGPNGAEMDKFGWCNEVDRTVITSSTTPVKPDGFIPTTFDIGAIGDWSGATLKIPKGAGVALYYMGNFSVKLVDGTATRGAPVYARITDGAVVAVASGATAPDGVVETDFIFVESGASGDVIGMRSK